MHRYGTERATVIRQKARHGWPTPGCRLFDSRGVPAAELGNRRYGSKKCVKFTIDVPGICLR